MGTRFCSRHGDTHVPGALTPGTSPLKGTSYSVRCTSRYGLPYAHRIQACNQVLLRLTNAAITRRNTTLVEERRKFFNFKLKSQANASLQSSETLEKKKWKLEKSRQHLDELILHRDFYTVMCGEFHLFAGERIEESTSSNRVDLSKVGAIHYLPGIKEKQILRLRDTF